MSEQNASGASEASRLTELDPMSIGIEERNKAAVEMYDILLFRLLQSCLRDGTNPEGNLLREARQRFRDVGIVDASKTDDTKMGDLIKRALEAGGTMPDATAGSDEATDGD